MIETKKRVDRLERALERFVTDVGGEFTKLYKLQTQTEKKLNSFVDEMKDFKDEMKDFKDEMKDFKEGVKDFIGEMGGFKEGVKDFIGEMGDFKEGVKDFIGEMGDFKDEMKDFKDEMKDFKDEMKDFKDEMKDFKDEMKDFKDEMKDFKDEMKDFKDEMKDFKDESELDRKKMNKQWGELANKMGTIVEDITAPSLPRIVRELYGKEPELMMQNVEKKLKDGSSKEFDIIAILDDFLFVNSTKSTLRNEDIPSFVDDIQQLRVFFPEYKNKRIIGFIASLSVQENILKQAEKKGFYVMALGDDLMDLVNSKDFKPKEW